MLSPLFRIARAGLFLASILAFVFHPLSVLAAEETGTITGTVHTTSGAAIAGAQIVLTAAGRHLEANSDANGSFRFTTLADGLYQMQVNKGGYLSASAGDLAVFGGSTLTENVVLLEPDLSSLRTIATVRTSAHSSINTSTAAVTNVSAEAIQTLANPQINEVLQEIPSLNLSRTSSAPNTSISLGGAQPYETQVLLDGHPLSTGRYGSWISQYFNSYLLGGIETEIGAGNTTPFAGTAIGGTANLLTPSYNGHPVTSFLTGVDSYDSQYTDFLSTGKVGNNLSYVLGAGYNSENGPYQQSTGCIVTPSSAASVNKPGSTGIIQYCGQLGAPLFQKGEIAKLHYDFSNATSFEVGYIGSQSGFLPQASSYGLYAGNITIVNCLTNGHCTNPNYSSYVGKTINGYEFYPGSNVYNDQPLFEGQFRTAIGDNTLLVRPYAGSVMRDIDGGGESDYPNYYTAAGAAVPQSPYTTFELDHLHGTTVSFIHPFGENEVNATYDYHSDDTYAQAGNPTTIPFPVAVPNTLARTNIFSLTGNFSLTPNLHLAAGAYETNWQLNGWQTDGTTPLARSVSHFDPHLAFTYSPAGGLSYRLAVGTSVNFPYAGNISGSSYINQSSVTGAPFPTLNEKNPYLSPEIAHEWSAGVDKRLPNGGVLSLDYLGMNVNDVIETLTTQVFNNPQYQYINQPVNAAQLQAESAILKYTWQPTFGFGYYVAATFQHSVIQGIPLQAFSATSFTLPANGQQQCGGNGVCIPYMKAYGAVQYVFRDQTFATIGVDFEGANNSYYQAPLALVNATFRRPVTHQLNVQISADNLLNTNTYNNLVLPNLGVPMAAENRAGQFGSYTTSLIPAEPRTIRVQFEWRQQDGLR